MTIRERMLIDFIKAWYDIHNCVEVARCCRTKEAHNRKLAKTCELSVKLQKLGINITKLQRRLRV